MSVLAHDLRNPLATARMSAEILLKFAKKEVFARNSMIIKASTYIMEGMIQNILDFTRCQMNLGVEIQKQPANRILDKVLEQLIKEAKLTAPELTLRSDVILKSPVDCDPGRIGQLLTNLVRFAQTQASAESVVKIRMRSKGDVFTSTFTYDGPALSQEICDQLFDPQLQTEDVFKKGVGMGLYIASEIAKAHGGSLKLIRSGKNPQFCLEMKSK